MVLTRANQRVVAGYQLYLIQILIASFQAAFTACSILNTDMEVNAWEILCFCHMWWCQVDRGRDTGLQLTHTTFECTRKLKACMIKLGIHMCIMCLMPSTWKVVHRQSAVKMMSQILRTWVGLPILQQTLRCAVSGDLRPQLVFHLRAPRLHVHTAYDFAGCKVRSRSTVEVGKMYYSAWWLLKIVSTSWVIVLEVD